VTELSEKNADACVVAVEVDGRQAYLFESDKLREMLGASRIIAQSVEHARTLFIEKAGLHLHGPVSGVIHAWAPIENKVTLLDAAWRLREWLEARGVAHSCAYLETDSRHFTLDQESDANVFYPSLASVHQQLGDRIRRRKDGKGAVDARPRCSLFAACQIHGLEPANRWRPGGQRPDEDEPRRELVSERADRKLTEWEKEKNWNFYGKNLLAPVKEALVERGVKIDRIRTFSDLTELLDGGQGSDSYIAFVCADGDGMGRLLGQVNWNVPLDPPSPESNVWNGLTPWERNAQFAYEYNDCVVEAFTYAVRHLATHLDLDRYLVKEKFIVPLLPQVLGGDDLWMIIERRHAPSFVAEFASKYADLADRKLILRGAARSVGGDEGQAVLTVSLGIAFAKSGHPASAMAEAAEELLKSAKGRRKVLVDPQGCVDWHWIQSSRIEGMKEARDQLSYRDDGENLLHLTTRPWTLADMEKHKEGSVALVNVPRRKREQLETVLRLGLEESRLAWQGWWKSLTRKEQAFVEGAFKALGWVEGGSLPWRRRAADAETVNRAGYEANLPVEWETPLLDLLVVEQILGLETSGGQS